MIDWARDIDSVAGRVSRKAPYNRSRMKLFLRFALVGLVLVMVALTSAVTSLRGHELIEKLLRGEF